MPPPEGFGAVKYKRSLPFKGPSGLVLFVGVGLFMGWGWVDQIKVMWERTYVTIQVHLLSIRSARHLGPVARRVSGISAPSGPASDLSLTANLADFFIARLYFAILQGA